MLESKDEGEEQGGCSYHPVYLVLADTPCTQSRFACTRALWDEITHRSVTWSSYCLRVLNDLPILGLSLCLSTALPRAENDRNN